jgi:hypothetical protein
MTQNAEMKRIKQKQRQRQWKASLKKTTNKYLYWTESLNY